VHLILNAVQQDGSLVVGTSPCGYSLEVPKGDGGHYLTVWKHVGDAWRIASLSSPAARRHRQRLKPPTGEKP